MKTKLLSAFLGSMALALMVPGPAQAQFSQNYNFLKAVKDKDGQKVTDLLQDRKSVV